MFTCCLLHSYVVVSYISLMVNSVYDTRLVYNNNWLN